MPTHSPRSIQSRLEKKRDRLRAEADEIDRALATVRAVFDDTARNGFGAKLRQAVTAERIARGPGRPRTTSKAKRVDMTALVGHFGDTPVTIADIKTAMDLAGRTINAPIGSLLRYGYIKKKAGGYVRTRKPWPHGTAE